jgi:hypothetical protein
MRQRKLLLVIAGATILAHASRAQQKAIPVIDYVSCAQQQQKLPRIGWLLPQHSTDKD